MRVGRYGPYLERGEQRAAIPEDLPPGRARPGAGAPVARAGLGPARARCRSSHRQGGVAAQRPLRSLRPARRGRRRREAEDEVASPRHDARQRHARAGGPPAVPAARRRRRSRERRDGGRRLRALRSLSQARHRDAQPRPARGRVRDRARGGARRSCSSPSRIAGAVPPRCASWAPTPRETWSS